MPRQAFVILVSGLLLVAEAPQAAQALPKSFCRKWAAGVANNNIDYEAQARALERKGEAADLSAIKPGVQDPADLRSLSGSGLGGAMARLAKPARWHDIYRQAYAHCRVVDSY